MRDRMRVMSDVALSLSPVIGAIRAVTHQKLRVLAYHGVDSPRIFDWQMGHVSERYHFVSAGEVVAALQGEHRLPNHAVWVTFDDGLPSVVHNALPVLESREIKATMFVCPGVVDTSEPLWWQMVEICARDGVWPDSTTEFDSCRLIRHFKGLDNGRREFEIAKLSSKYLRRHGREPEKKQLRAVDLQNLLSAGHTVGNHTWTHPLLDQCGEAVQREQIVRAHDWLKRELGIEPVLFAFPNGNATSVSEQVLRELNYHVAVTFDHRLAKIPADPLRVSRLRTDDENTTDRFTAILAGSHSMASAVRPNRSRR